ncbi:MAG: hypothetical protein AABZ60_14850 [Planctomycetota bacterium]
MVFNRSTQLIKILMYDPQNPEVWLELAEYFARKSVLWDALLCYEQTFLLQPDSLLLAQQISQFLQKSKLLENTPLASPEYECVLWSCLRCGNSQEKSDPYLCSCGGILGPILTRKNNPQPLYPQIFPKNAIRSQDRRYLLVNLHQAFALFGERNTNLEESRSVFDATKPDEFRPLLQLYLLPVYPWLIYYTASSGADLHPTQDLYFQWLAYLGIQAMTFSPLGNQALLGLRIPVFRPASGKVLLQERVIRWPKHQLLFQQELEIQDPRLPANFNTSGKEFPSFEWDFTHKCFFYVQPQEKLALPKAFPEEELFQAFSYKKAIIEPTPSVDDYASPLWNASYSTLKKIISSLSLEEQPSCQTA